jgi:flavin reductase (DIM6/NTAB) family NADH-FMN oxidoreductase RutF
MKELALGKKIHSLDTDHPIWDHFYTVAPLVIIGTKEGNSYNLAPKHMVTPLGYDNYFGFVCTPRHSTYHNVVFYKEFTVSFPIPDEVVLTSLTASPRCEEADGKKKILNDMPILPGVKVNAPFFKHSYLFLECALDRIVEGFGSNSLIAGHIIGAYVHEDYKRHSDKDDQEQIYRQPLLAYLAYGRFARIAETMAFPFPKDFKI